MLRWRLSTVRTLGRHDSGSILPSCHVLHTLLVSRFSRACAEAAVPIEDYSEQPEVPFVASCLDPRPQDAPCTSLRPATHLTDGYHPRTLTCSPASHSAVDILMRFLSPENVASDRPLVYSPTAIRSLYYSAESMNQLGILSSNMFTLLIALFGSLSIHPRVSTMYGVPLTSHLLRISAHRTHWAFVLKVGRHKLQQGMILEDSDRFWLMHAELAIAQSKSPSEPDSYRAIVRARKHYRIIRRHSRRSEVHTYYLESLLAIRVPRLLDVAARDLSFLLRTHRVSLPWLQRLFCRLVLQHGHSLSTRSQETILAALWNRIRQGNDMTSDVPRDGLSSVAVDGCITDATTLARSLSAALFGFVDTLPNAQSAKSFGPLFSVFCPVYTLSLRWSLLSLFCAFNFPGMFHFSRTWEISDLAASPVTSCWQAIFGLAIAEKMSQDKSSTPLSRPIHAEQVMNMTRALCQQWLPVTRSRVVSQDLACVITASFLGIAGILKDLALFYDCQELYRMENHSEVTRTAAQKAFTVQYIAAALRVDDPLPDVVLITLNAFSSNLGQQYQVLALVVETLAPLDPTLARVLYTVVQGKEMRRDPAVAHTIAIAFARHGALHEAILVLRDGPCSTHSRIALMSAIARSLRESPRVCYSPSVFVAIVDELAALYCSRLPPEHFRRHLEQLVIYLAMRVRGNRLSSVVTSILRKSPGFFRPRFFVRYCHVLLRRKQFAIARNVLEVIAIEQPTLAQSLRALTNLITLQTRALRASRRTILLRNPTSLRLSSRLRHCTLARGPLEHSLQELLRSGRVLAAKHIFARVAATASSKRCTVLGNILLHGVSRQPTPRNGRRVRKIVALLENLAGNHGFRPDRVTANILIKVMIHWRAAFDSTRLRELFDQLVRGGYPAAEYSPLHPPFGTRQTQILGSSGIARLPPFISFEKHSRPLFKMFIKAFYSCNDVEAARKVVGILKVEEYRHGIEKNARQKARRRGSMKTAQGNVFPIVTKAVP